MDEQLKKYAGLVERHRELCLRAERRLWAMPEAGYREWRSSAYLQGEFEALGYQVHTAGDIPGFTACLDTGRPGPCVAVIGELDALFCETHPEADPQTKAVHACGHHTQCAIVLGCAAALAEPEALEGLSGSIRFILVPAEETIDLEYRNSLIRQGVIHSVAGKVEFLRRGLLNGVDMMILVHAANLPEGKQFIFHDGSDGCITKHLEYQGVAAHAGIAPEEGVNALYAAALGLQACNSLRETFREQDYIRFHPIVTQAGVAANAIPDLAKLDAYVRAAAVPEMLETNRRINRALAASAAAMGGNLRICDTPGNMPLRNDPALQGVFIGVARELFGGEALLYMGQKTDSTDLGDLSTLMPVIHPHTGGSSGTVHGQDFRITDPVRAVVNPAKAVCGTIARLLREDAAQARQVLADYRPLFPSPEAYFQAVSRIGMDRTAVDYSGDGTVTLRFADAAASQLS